MDFQPGALVQIGKEIPEDELVITEESRLEGLPEGKAADRSVSFQIDQLSM